MSGLETVNGVYKWVDKSGRTQYTQTPPQPDELPVAPADPESAKEVAKRFLDNKCKGIIYADEVTHAESKACIELAKKGIKIPGFIDAVETARFARARIVPGAGNGVSNVVSAYGKAGNVLSKPSGNPTVLDTMGKIVEKPPYYSDSRYGQLMKVEDPKMAKAGAASQAAAIAASRSVPAAAGVAVGRVLGPLVSIGTDALKPEVADGVSAMRGLSEKNRLVNLGILTPEEGDLLPGMYARREFAQIRELTEAGVKRKQGN
jgi:Domain of unknown function (DUF4124)